MKLRLKIKVRLFDLFRPNYKKRLTGALLNQLYYLIDEED